MTISVRLSDQSESESELRTRTRRSGRPLSEFVREAIEEKLARDAQDASPYGLGKELFGRYGSGDGGGNRSTDRKRLIRERLSEKHRH